MERATSTVEPRFVDEQNDLVDPMPIFVTRTTLRAILNKHEAKTSSDLGKMDGPTSPRATMDE